MYKYITKYVGLDVHKEAIAVARPALSNISQFFFLLHATSKCLNTTASAGIDTK
jgi:hypothetical protein